MLKLVGRTPAVSVSNTLLTVAVGVTCGADVSVGVVTGSVLVGGRGVLTGAGLTEGVLTGCDGDSGTVVGFWIGDLLLGAGSGPDEPPEAGPLELGELDWPWSPPVWPGAF